MLMDRYLHGSWAEHGLWKLFGRGTVSTRKKNGCESCGGARSGSAVVGSHLGCGSAGLLNRSERVVCIPFATPRDTECIRLRG